MAANPSPESTLVLDQGKVGGEGSDAYVFQYLSGALRTLESSAMEDIKSDIPAFEANLVSISLSSAPFTSPPGRPIRSLVAKCLKFLYGKGETKGLFDMLNKLILAISDIKEKEGVRIAALYIAGELMGSYGYQVMSLMVEFALQALKTYRLSSASTILRYHALRALAQALPTAGRALTDQIVKDIHKNMKSALSDKALPLQRAACSVFIGLYPNTSVPAPAGTSPPVTALSSTDMDSLITQVMKSLDNPDIDTTTRLAHAGLIGHFLASSQAFRAIPAPAIKLPPVSSSNQAEDDSATSGAAKSQPEITAKPLLQPGEMLAVLSSLMNKQSSTRRQRVGLIHAYHVLFNILGASWVESHYSHVLSHLAKDLLSAPKVTAGSRAERVWTRKAVGILLRETIGERMLSEQGLISAVMEGVNGFLRPYLSAILYSAGRPLSPSGNAPTPTAAFIRAQTERPPNNDTLMVVLQEMAGLLKQLGNAPAVIQELLGGGEVLVTVACSAAGPGVRGSAVAALCSFIRASPGRMGVLMETLHEGLKRDITTLGTIATQMASAAGGSSGLPSLAEIKARALGHAYSMYGIYNLLGVSDAINAIDTSNSSSAASFHSNIATSLHLHLPPISPTLLHTATGLLKATLDQPLPVARINSEIGWTLLSGLMALGPHFVRPNLSALMVLWRNALPKPTVRDNSSVVGKEEWGFLLGVRGWAVGAMCAFLRYNNSPTAGELAASGITGAAERFGGKPLVTLDISRRLGTLLSNALGFTNLFITAQKEEMPDPTSPTGASINMYSQADEDGFDLQGYEALLRSHIHVAFSLLGFSTVTESVQRELITSTISLFASHDSYSGSGLQVAIAAREGTFKGVWKTEDGYAYGVTSIVLDDIGDGDSASGNAANPGITSALPGGQNITRYIRDIPESEIEQLLVQPILGSPENDPLSLTSATATNSVSIPLYPVPPATAVVDTALELFSLLLCSQDSNGALKALNGLVDTAKGNVPGDRTPMGGRTTGTTNLGRKMATLVNAVWALVLSLRLIMGRNSTPRTAKEVFGSAQVGNILGDFLKEGILQQDEKIRQAASEALGRLSSLSSSTFLGTQINNLVKEVVNNRDPSCRAGCAAAFGTIYVYAGGLAAQPYLKTVLNVIMSLANDPHPVVHYWSLDALSQIIAASSLSYGPYVSSTLSVVLKIYVLETHEPEGGSIAQANASGDLPTYQALCRIVDGIISALGPELQDSVKSRRMIVALVYQMLASENEGVGVEAIQCLRQILMFAPASIDVPGLVTRFRGYLASPRSPLKMASINALYQLVQKDAFLLSKVGGDKLVEVLFGMLDQDDSSSMEGVKSIITSWLSQTVTAAPSAWIDLCQRIMARTSTASQQQAGMSTADSKGTGFQDDESESLGAALPGGQPGEGTTAHSTARWRTQLFAMECLHRICMLVSVSGKREHLDMRFAKQRGIPIKGLLVARIPDLIRMAFTASAAYVIEIRLGGLRVIRDVIEIFSKSPDPDYDDALLLEQHQAPVTAALTPAFSSDSTPEILAAAVQVCAVFVGCGVIKDVSKMGRILKLLTGALEQSKSSGQFAIGDVQQMSPNAAVMLKVSTLTAWAELQIASTREEYLVAVVEPYRATLATLWVGALRDYASIRGDSEIAQESSGAMEGLYLNLGKEILLPYYTDSWYQMLKAMAIMMKAQDPYILSAMDGKEGQPTVTSTQREGPAAFFFVIFGLIYEALAESSTSSSASGSANTVTIAALEALDSLVRPDYAGKAILDSAVFDEFTTLCYRMAMMESAEVHIPLARVVSSLATTQLGSSGNMRRQVEDQATITQRTHCLRICSYILRRALPSSGNAQDTLPETRILLLKTAFTSLTQIGSTFGPEHREDMRGISIALYSELLKDELSEYDLVGPTLPALKTMLETNVSPSAAESPYSRLVHGLVSCCLQNIEETSGRSGPAVTLKTKNNLFAAVLILTVIPSTVKMSRALIDQFCYLISQRLIEISELTLAATQCAKTLITASLVPTCNPALKYCAGLLIPALINLTSNAAISVDDAEKLAAISPSLDETLKTFTVFFTGVQEPFRQAALAIILPTLSLLLDPSRSPTSTLHNQTVPIVLNCATSSPGPFKEVMDRLVPSAKDVLESSIRQALASRPNTTSAQAAAKPQISLKAF